MRRGCLGMRKNMKESKENNFACGKNFTNNKSWGLQISPLKPTKRASDSLRMTISKWVRPPSAPKTRVLLSIWMRKASSIADSSLEKILNSPIKNNVIGISSIERIISTSKVTNTHDLDSLSSLHLSIHINLIINPKKLFCIIYIVTCQCRERKLSSESLFTLAHGITRIVSCNLYRAQTRWGD